MERFALVHVKAGLASRAAPAGVRPVDDPGAVPGITKPAALDHGPNPKSFQVCIHHCQLPAGRSDPGVQLVFADPASQKLVCLVPFLLSQIWYHEEVETCSHASIGLKVATATSPVGERRVAPGGRKSGTVNVLDGDHVPYPYLFHV